MPQVADLIRILEQFAPTIIAEDWDNVGLLVGDRDSQAVKIMTCLTLTPKSVQEAIQREADVVVAHHPIPFRPIKRLTRDTVTGKMLLDLIQNQIAVYSPHTAFDSTIGGINQQLAQHLGLQDIRPLTSIAQATSEDMGIGRYGSLKQPQSLLDVAKNVKTTLSANRIKWIGSADQKIESIAVGCGSAGQLLQDAMRLNCDAFVTGETSFHTCLHAEATGIGLILPGHFATERFAVEWLADFIQKEMPDAHSWASQWEKDPVQWI